MTENTPRPCLKCGSETRKYDVCSACRKRAAHAPRGFVIPRSEINRLADEILSMSKEEARKRYEDACYTIKILGGDAPRSVWQEKKQMYAILTREEITENTLI